MQCDTCGSHFNEDASPICGSCGTNHSAKIRQLRKQAKAEAPARERPPQPARARPASEPQRAVETPAVTEADWEIDEAALEREPEPDEGGTAWATQALVERVLKQARAAARRGDHAAVEDLSRSGLEAAPTHVELQGLHGVALLEQGKVHDAELCFERIKNKHPDHPQLRYWLKRVDVVRERLRREADDAQREKTAEERPIMPPPHEGDLPPLATRWPAILSSYLVATVIAVGLGLGLCAVEIVAFRPYIAVPVALALGVGTYLRLVANDPYRPVFGKPARTACAVAVVLVGYVASLYAPLVLDAASVVGTSTMVQRLMFRIDSASRNVRGITSSAGVASATREAAAGYHPQAGRSLWNDLMARATSPVDFYAIRLGGASFWLVTGLELVLAVALVVRTANGP